jgi:hypothetical protein
MNSIPVPTVLGLFAKLFSQELAQQWLQSQSSEPNPGRPRGFYRRIFSLVVTLWYLIFQRLNADKTQDAVVKDARRGGADRFSPSRRERLSKKIRSNATTSYNDARQRMPLEFLQWALRRIGEHVQEGLRQSGVALRSFQLIDGSTLPVLWNPSLGQAYPPARNQHGRSDWCLMRVVVGFCAFTGVVLSATEGPMQMGEQALAWTLMAQALAGTVWIGDRNFGIWSIAAQAVLNHQDVIVRLTQSRAVRLSGGGTWVSGQDQVVEWHRSKHDKIAPGTEEVQVKGRLIFVRVAREGRFVNLWLFTTLMDQEAFPISRLVELYGWRWQAEVDFRYLKTSLDLQKLEVKSPEMARKEFYAALIAYDLVRVVMAGAAEFKENQPRSPLSFSQVRRVLLSWLNDWAKDWRSRQGSLSKKIEQLIAEAALQKLPNRKKPRPSEPRRARRRSAKFPPLIGSRAAARKKLTLSN